ncbi:hypothetical protein SH449x_003068 [Pirellulaceae bacterium SH449]
MNTTIGFDNRKGRFNATWHSFRVMPTWIVLIAGFAGLLFAGCQTLTLPRIDPTGNRIFAPGGTTIINPLSPTNGYPSTAPAFRDPPKPPKCIDGESCQGCLSCFTKKGNSPPDFERGRCGELLLTPNRLVAPVGGEVILLAGVCGKDGLLVTGEQIEWMLSPESVGQIVDVGDDAKGQKPSFWKKSEIVKVEKLGVDFARGRTSRESSVITKGTADPSDDLPLRKGQTWVSLTSPSEGTSKVTVLAPSSDVWDKRRQTATIYWVDASWDFPQPVVEINGAPAILATKVMKSDGYVAAEGWTVSYRSLNPEYARFVVGNNPQNYIYSDQADVTVDSNGIAGVTLVRGPFDGATSVVAPANGTALVEVEIVRPAIGDMPEVPLARTTTSVTWSAPNLMLDVFGPEIATPGQSLQYVIRVSNTGDLAAENVEVIASFPPGLRVDYSYRPIRETDGSAVWGQFGPIAPRSVFEVVANVTPTAEMQARIQVDVRTSSGQQIPTRTIPIIVQAPKLGIQFGPRQNIVDIPVNEQVIFDGLLVNNGTQTINDVRVEIEADSGLVDDRYGQSKITTTYPAIRPSERIPFEVPFRVIREGTLRISASAMTQGQTLASQSVSIRGLSNTGSAGGGPIGGTPNASPKILLETTVTPDSGQLRVGSTVTLRCVVTNPGSTVLPTPVLALAHDANFQVQNLDPKAEYDPNRGLIIWRIRDMVPQQSLEFKAIFTAVRENGEAVIEMDASSGDAVDAKNVRFAIINGSASPPLNGGGSTMPSPDRGMFPGGAPPSLPGIPDGSNPGSGLPALPVLPGGSNASNGSSSRLSLPVSHNNGLKLDQRLGLTIQPVGESFRRGDVVTYEITVSNLAQQPDQKVALQLNLPSGAKVISLKAPSLSYRTSEDGRIVEFTPIQFFRTQDSFSYVVQLKHEQVGKAELSAAARSLGQPTPVFAKRAVVIQ